MKESVNILQLTGSGLQKNSTVMPIADDSATLKQHKINIKQPPKNLTVNPSTRIAPQIESNLQAP